MKIKELYLKLMNTITMKVFATLLVLDICLSWYYSLWVDCSVIFYICLKLFLVAIVYFAERDVIKQIAQLEPPSKFWVITESISIIIQLMIVIYFVVKIV